MVKVSGVPYDVDPSDIKVSVSEIQKQAMNQGIDIAIEYLNELHKMHESLHSFYKFAAKELENKKL
jgi:Na+/phosphate symporter